MKWVKKNKLTIIALVVFTLISVVGYKTVKMFFPDVKSAIYGDRLDGKVAVSKETYETVKEKVKGQEFVKDIKIRENGRTINVDIQVMDSTSIDAAKGLSSLVVEDFNEMQTGYYDFQIFVTKESVDENNFPIIGYKHHNRSEFSWTRNREKVEKTEDKEG